MTKIYTIEVTQESRALVTIEAENLTEAQDTIKKQIADKTIKWAMQDHIVTDVINSRDKKD